MSYQQQNSPFPQQFVDQKTNMQNPQNIQNPQNVQNPQNIQNPQMVEMKEEPHWNPDSGFQSRMSNEPNYPQHPQHFAGSSSGFRSQPSGLISHSSQPSSGSDFNSHPSGYSSQPSGFHSGYNSQQSGFISQQSGAQTPALSMHDDDGHGMNFEYMPDEYNNGMVYNEHMMNSNPVSHMSTPFYQEQIDDNLMGDVTVMPYADQPKPEVGENVNQFESDNNYATAKRDIVEVIPLLQDEDNVVVSQALLFVLDLLKRAASKNAVLESEHLIGQIIGTIHQKWLCDDIDIIRTGVKVLSQVSQDKDKNGLKTIFENNGIFVLLNLLTSSCETTQSYALTTFHTLLTYCKDNKLNVTPMVREGDGMRKIVFLLARDNAKFLAVLADCIHMLTYNNPEGKKEMLKCGGTAQMMHIMRQNTDSRLLGNLVRALKVLSVCEENQLEIIQGGGIEALAGYLDSVNRSSSLYLNCLLTIRNLAGAVHKLPKLPISENAARSLISAVNGTHEPLVTIAAGCLSNLTCSHDLNKATICQVDGLPILIETIKRFYPRDEIVEPAARALKNLTSGERGTEVAQHQALLFSLPGFIQLLEPSRQWQVASASIGLIRNLAKCNCYSIPLREQGAIPALVLRLKMAAELGLPVVDGVKMNDIVQSTLVTLSILSHDKDNRRIIREQAVIPTLVRLFSSNPESIHGPAVSVVHLLATDPEGVQMIYETVGRNETVRALKQLSNSPTELIKKFASGILHVLGKYQQNRRPNRQPIGMTPMNAQHWTGSGLNNNNNILNNNNNNDIGSFGFNRGMDSQPGPVWAGSGATDMMDQESFMDSLDG